MSGISGIFNLDGAPVDRDLLRRMTELIGHRGPDGTGYWTGGPVGFGHQMFCTTPESLHEKQPLANESGTLCLTFDGRVDNREELQAALRSQNVHLREDTDAELVLRAYECWGETSPHKILGDFAYAIWDSRARRLFCARDILGLKPFYYYTNGRIFLFGSELRQLFEFKELAVKPNEGMIAEHLADEVTNREETFWEGILRVPPAHALVVEPGRVPRKPRYWDIVSDRKLRYGTDQEYAEHFLRVFKESVRCRLRSPGRSGVELSGGLDSSSIACVSAFLKSEDRTAISDFETFSLVFPGRDCDEARYFESAVSKWNLGNVLVREELKDVRWYAAQVERYRDLADYPNSSMSEPLFKAATERGVKVLLNGIGGDQWFEGCSVGNSPGRMASLPRRVCGFYRLSQEMGFAAALRHAGGRLREAFGQTAAQGTGVPRWIAPGFARKTSLADRINSAVVADTAEPGVRKLRTLLDSGWTVHSNEMTERSQSFAAVDGRSPFFDRRIIEFSFAIPEEQRGREKRTKIVLRNAMRGLLPETIRNRPCKAEFGHTFRQALAGSEARRSFGFLTLGKIGWVDPDAVRWMYDRAMTAHSFGRRAGNMWPLWVIFATEMWAGRFVFANTVAMD